MKFSDLIKRLLRKEEGLNLNNPEHLKLIKKVYGSYYAFKNEYEKMYQYYKGNTDAIKNYKFVTERSNLKINTNFVKKFIKQEVSYTVGNEITYESKKGDENIINDIEYYTAHWNELHDSDLMKYMLIFTKIYELYYLNENADFCSKIIKPTEGYAYTDNSGKVLFFIHTFSNEFDSNERYIDVYTSERIYHLNSQFTEIAKPTDHVFGMVPVTVGDLTQEGKDDSLYKDIKGLQDAFETNLSDIGNEISDFRNAYLLFKNAQIDEANIPNMKKLGVIQFPDSTNGDASWLIKDINDTFIQNTLDRYEDTMYQIACHINHNEKMQSNLSGVALRSRLIALEHKCKLDGKAHKNIVKSRLKFLFIYLNIKKNINHDYKDIKSIYTPNIPQDDLSTAQMLSQAPEGVISRDTSRGLFSFISNKSAEAKKVNNEQKEEIKNNLTPGDDMFGSGIDEK